MPKAFCCNGRRKALPSEFHPDSIRLELSPEVLLPGADLDLEAVLVSKTRPLWILIFVNTGTTILPFELTTVELLQAPWNIIGFVLVGYS
jgi:hypothetical protein